MPTTFDRVVTSLARLLKGKRAICWNCDGRGYLIMHFYGSMEISRPPCPPCRGRGYDPTPPEPPPITSNSCSISLHEPMVPYYPETGDGGLAMDIDADRIDDALLALLYLGLHDRDRVWKTFDWKAMNRLHVKGLITDPVNKSKSVVLTEEGLRESERLFQEMFVFRR